MNFSSLKHVLFTVLITIISFSSNIAYSQTTKLLALKGKVRSEYGSDVASFASISLRNAKQHYQISANEQGDFIIKSILPGKYELLVSSLNYKIKLLNIQLNSDTTLNISLSPAQKMLDEVFVTASAVKGKPSTSVIDRNAMQLLQPSSFTDLLELLPGGRSVDPKLTGANLIQLRTPSNYVTGDNMASLGTAFYVDGAPLSTTANMQSTDGFTSSDPNGSRNVTNKGIDMRSISTDQIERVEIVRGIPSAEYGDLTSGLVKIERKKGSTPYTARIKADGFSKLFSIGKGVSLLEKNLYINANFDFLDSKSDPRDNFENYKRISGSLRTEKFWDNANRKLTWNTAFDYATNVDNERSDPDNSYALTDSYTSKYNSYGLTNTINFKFKQGILKEFQINNRVGYQNDVIDLTKWIQARTATVLVNSLVAGAHEAKYATPFYAADLDVEGKPLNIFLKAAATLGFNSGTIKHDLKLGTEWNYSKNFGAGQMYDLDLPPVANVISTVRPRSFDAVPALQNLSFFAQDNLSYAIGKNQLNLSAGLRGMALLDLNKNFKMANKPYVDPRLNFLWDLPSISINQKPLKINVGSGFGLHTKLPTLDMLYPTDTYIDNIQLNYFPNNPEYRIANAYTTIINRVNYDLDVAVNKKWELNTELLYAGNRLSITYFRERMNNGFRTASRYQKINYKLYDVASVNADQLTAKPKVEDFSYDDRSEYYGYTINSNGSGVFKEGIEYQFTSKRISAINTRFTLNGAWFNNRYFGSNASYKTISTSGITDGKVRQYIGLYEEDEGSNYQQLNTNLIIDSYLPQLGLQFSASVQSLWFTSRKENYNSGTPIAYMGIDEVLHPYTEQSKLDPNLRALLELYTDSKFRRNTVPFDMQVNLKASKEFKNKARISMFVNRFLTYSPSYTSFLGNTVVRRSASPYFGMELNFSL